MCASPCCNKIQPAHRLVWLQSDQAHPVPQAATQLSCMLTIIRKRQSSSLRAARNAASTAANCSKGLRMRSAKSSSSILGVSGCAVMSRAQSHKVLCAGPRCAHSLCHNQQMQAVNGSTAAVQLLLPATCLEGNDPPRAPPRFPPPCTPAGGSQQQLSGVQ